jgi:hypothetical protein
VLTIYVALGIKFLTCQFYLVHVILQAKGFMALVREMKTILLYKAES